MLKEEEVFQQNRDRANEQMTSILHFCISAFISASSRIFTFNTEIKFASKFWINLNSTAPSDEAQQLVLLSQTDEDISGQKSNNKNCETVCNLCTASQTHTSTHTNNINNTADTTTQLFTRFCLEPAATTDLQKTPAHDSPSSRRRRVHGTDSII